MPFFPITWIAWIAWITWIASVAFVLLSGACAWWEGNGRRRPGLDIGFVEHGGMWGDLVLLPVANAAIVPLLVPGAWLAIPLAAGTVASWWLHRHWHRGGDGGPAWREHLWPTRARGTWHGDLSWAGWLHALYVALELALLLAYAVTPAPHAVVLLVSAILTLHVPLGLLAPAWAATGRLIRNRLLVPALAIVWLVALAKW